MTSSIASQTARFTVELDATPSSASSDSAFGLSRGAATGWGNLAAIVRFNATGRIDARNGSGYAAATAVTYSAGKTYHVRMTVDVSTHKYSVFVRQGSGAEQTIASQYAFRSEQATVGSLDRTAIRVDGSGTLAICGLTLEGDDDGGSGSGSGSGSGGGGDTMAPSVTLTAPTNGAAVSGVIPVSATASDNVGVTGVQFYVDGNPAGSMDTSSPYSISFDTKTIANGAHSVTARAKDAAGHVTTSAAANITVNNAVEQTLCGVDPEPTLPPGPRATRTPPAASGTTYRVSPNGGASAPCTTSQPCREITRALTLVHPGDVVLVDDGTYQRFSIDGLHATAAKPIVIFATGHAANIAPGPNTNSGRYSIYLYDVAHLVIDGINAANAPRAAIGVFESVFVTIQNGIYANNGTWGLLGGFCDDCAFIHNEFSGSSAQHGLYVSNSGDRHLIRANLVHHNKMSGIQINADGSIDDSGSYAGAVDGISSGNCIERNKIYNNGAGGGGALNFDGVQDSLVRNNLIYANTNTGIANFREDGSGGPKGMALVGNTVVMPSNGRSGVQFIASAGANMMRDNIILHASTSKGGLDVRSADASLLDSDYNIIERVMFNGSVTPIASYRTGSREPNTVAASAASLFIDAANGNYHLSAASAAHGTGQARSEATLDFEGLVRNASGGVCRGAYDSQ
ncbi:MAG: Ig-like domain-containing protein [Kofleriaceae bacterium]